MRDVDRKQIVNRARRVIVKVGSSVLIDSSRGLQTGSFNNLAKQIGALRDKGRQVILVSSGAIAAGIAKMGLSHRPHDISQKQALAAIGQSRLMQLYEHAFERYGTKVAQVLLTHDDLAHRRRFLNARDTLHALLSYKALPIINENDTVAVHEIQFGDNDRLAALITHLLEADLLILLTNVDGLLGPDSRPIPCVERIDDSIKKGARDDKSPFGLGGMKAKLEAAQIATSFGVPTIIANGFTPHILERLFEGESLGTLFLPHSKKLQARKHWIAHTLRSKGGVVVDSGAEAAVLNGKKSLLPSGIVAIRGHFDRGEMIDILNEKGETLAKGLTGYASEELEKIQGLKSSQIESVLGYKYGDEAIHRDNLVISE
ncbi:MAG: glutamate 5-kinase [Deltaproteobacteria bacterium]|nr:glutamate 5-kinase [Deltaproteobacteria bacterium]